ncbi:hypothetical protein LEP1GSC137_3658 [Leptospira borgpetersenii str. Noumea 25]|nr:hypothetical protein LEP1GSC137_3658 [Leptospira borgpetersenii str. Noumea 25]
MPVFRRKFDVVRYPASPNWSKIIRVLGSNFRIFSSWDRKAGISARTCPKTFLYS